MEQAIVRERVELKVADGTKMAAYVARPQEEGPHSGVIVFAGGLRSQLPHSRCDRTLRARRIRGHRCRSYFIAPRRGLKGATTTSLRRAPYESITMDGRRAGLAGQLCMAGGAARRERGRYFRVGFCMGGKISFSGQHSVAPARDRVVLRRAESRRIH